MVPESELIERVALEDLHRAALPSQIKALGLQGLTVGSAFVSIASLLPASAIVINRAVGIGLAGPASRETVVKILTAYRNAGVPRYFIHRHPAARPPELVTWLEDEGLAYARSWQKFSRGTAAVREGQTDLQVREIGPAQGQAFGRIACMGFDLGDAAIPWLAQLPGRKGWHIFMSFDGDKPAGVGTLFVQNGLAWMDFAATAPEFRRRGSQGAILAMRVKRALELGCHRMYTCTGVAVRGDPQHSYRNILKAGFHEDYVRENYALPRA